MSSIRQTSFSSPRTTAECLAPRMLRTTEVVWSVESSAVSLAGRTSKRWTLRLLLDLPSRCERLEAEDEFGVRSTLNQVSWIDRTIAVARCGSTTCISVGDTHLGLTDEGAIIYARSRTLDALGIEGGRAEMVSGRVEWADS
jgi:hypothetical protein